MYGNSHTSIDQRMRDCIEECHHCHDICTETITHCLEMGGDHADPKHIRLLLDCAEICQTSANFMLRASDLHGQVCDVCATVYRSMPNLRSFMPRNGNEHVSLYFYNKKKRQETRAR